VQEPSAPAAPSYAQLLEQNAQLRELVQSLTAQLASQQKQILELQARLGKNSTNSSKPPSSDALAKPAPKSLRVAGQRPIGAPKGHPGSTLKQSQAVDEVTQHFGPAQCSVCSSLLVDHEVLERRQVLELPVLRAQVIEHQSMRSFCTCGAVQVGVFPAGVCAPVQYGARLKAVCVNLNQQQFVPLARTCEVLLDTFGVAVSETSVLAFTHEAAQVLESVYKQIAQAVQAAPVVCADETGIRIQGQPEWLHCAVTPRLSYLEHHPQRGMRAMEKIGILGKVKGTLVHDGGLSRNPRKFRHPNSSPATSASKSIVFPSLWNV
jgi:transposase